MMESEQERSRFRERKPKNKINHVFNRKAALHRFDIDAPDDWEPKQGSEPINIKEEEEEVETSLEGEQLKMTPVPLKSEDGEEEPLISQIHRHQMKGRDLPIISSADEESCRGAETTWHPGLNTHEDGPSSPETEDIHEDAWDNDDDQQRALSIDAPDGWGPNIVQQGSETLNIKEEETGLEGEQLNETSVPLKSEDREEKPQISQIYLHQMRGRDLPISSSANEECWRGAETTWNPDVNTPEDGPNSPETEDSDEDAWDNDDDQQRALSIDAPDGWGPNMVQQGSETLNIKEEETSLEGEQPNGKEETDANMFSFSSVPLKSEDDEEETLISQIHQHQMEGGDLPVSRSADKVYCRGAETSCNPDVNTHEDDPSSPETEDSHEDSGDNDALPVDVLQVVVGEEEVLEDWRPDVDQQEPKTLGIKEEEENLWTSVEDQFSGLKKPDATRFSFNGSLKSEGEEEEPLGSMIHPHQKEGRELSINSSVEQMAAVADEDDCGEQTTWSPNLNTCNSTETEDSEDDEEVEDNPRMQLKLLSEPGSKTEDTIHTGPKSSCYDPCDESSQNINFNAQMTILEGQKVFACDVCGQRFSLNSHLNTHMTIHTGQKLFSCDVCGRCFCQKMRLNIHMRIHARQKPFGCDFCRQRFTRKASLNTHMRIHTGQKMFGCDVCGQRFTLKGNLNRHMRIHTGQKPFSCDACGQSFRQKIHLNMHMWTHTGKKPFGCNVCRQRFARRSSLKTHVRIHTGHKMFGCDVCGQKFTRKANLSTHMSIHTGQKMFSCDVCGQRFTLKGNLNRHMRIHTGPKPFSCVICGQSFRQKIHLNMHMGSHIGQKSFVCDVCGLKFTQNTSLNRHLRIHTGPKPFSCDVCGQNFSQKIHLNMHMESHSGQKPFGCDICGLKFTQKASLNRHLKIHTGQKPFSCDVCGHSFTQKAHLSRHMRTHTGHKPFNCDVCGHSCTQKAHLSIHMRTHTGQKPFGCDVCGQRFTRNTSLNIHMRKHTGWKPFGCHVCGQRFTRNTSLNIHMRKHTG
nr:zinc finger protein 135 isoform X2 [Nothobranchius furzeri]